MILNTISNKSPNDITPILGDDILFTCMETTNKQRLGYYRKEVGGKTRKSQTIG
jgi:hypothetical protein